MKDKKTQTLTVASLPTWIQNGDTLEMFDPSGRRKGEYKVTSITSGTTAKIRGLRWYERAWLSVKLWVRRNVLGITTKDDIHTLVAELKKVFGIK